MELNATFMDANITNDSGKTIVLSCFLILEAWEEIVDILGTYGPHQQVVDKVQLDDNLSKQHKKHFKQAQ
eukprot:482517-Ditylum_brightwellii.AAC.1